MAVSNDIIDISSSAAPTQPPPSASHRLPTQSASTALLGLSRRGPSFLTTGIGSLDRQLAPQSRNGDGGLERGKIAELWGPVGAGKTALAFQTAKGALKRTAHVVWIDCATLLSGASAKGIADAADSFHYVAAPTLSHLLALIISPPAGLIPRGTVLLVVDGLNTLVDLDYPRLPYNSRARTDQQKGQAGRRYAILGSIMTALNKLAALHDLAVIVTTGCSSRMRHDSGLGASISPGIGGSEWENGISSRMLIFRDFDGRFIGVQRCLGRNVTPLDPVGDVRNVVGFEFTASGALEEHIIDLTSSTSDGATVQKPSVLPSPAKVVRKRIYDEIADSEDDEDEYGWAEADDVAIATQTMPERSASVKAADAV
ncbi:hypothetical protein DOTSEDRAFT_48641 [Dothistroma septosporum NZE10]|uniref:RecA family profile 1 domain-containing protein n=1 Tax=Dothistroma septosporum (strain NZE10 / CBS 128990) TaxID=675120 RepID=N1PE00_DOTSN|nr:hypothetical protein DOTSEDRAFT_48641 [Dothistroma septosporum NZE10]